jgi:hypothetical protein
MYQRNDVEKVQVSDKNWNLKMPEYFFEF